MIREYLVGNQSMIKKVGNATISAKHRATCHCGSVELELDLPDGIVDPRRYDCSLCWCKGAIYGVGSALGYQCH